MGTNKIIHYDETIDIINKIFFIVKDNLTTFIEGKYFAIYFMFNDIKIRIETYRSIYYPEDGVYYEITLHKEGFEYSNFNILYAYYENKSFNSKFHYNLVYEYFKFLKNYIIENKLYFFKYDSNSKKRFLYFQNTIKEVPTIIKDYEAYYYQVFGSKAKNILNNRPIYK